MVGRARVMRRRVRVRRVLGADDGRIACGWLLEVGECSWVVVVVMAMWL
jgi:hypothetical protein